MPGQAYAMSGMGASFRPAGPCPEARGPHCKPDGDGSFMVADAATRDGTAGARVVLWRCRFCGARLTGIGRLGEEADTQEFTWLEEAGVPLAAGPGKQEAAAQ
jgi:hypothetical protein